MLHSIHYSLYIAVIPMLHVTYSLVLYRCGYLVYLCMLLRYCTKFQSFMALRYLSDFSQRKLVSDLLTASDFIQIQNGNGLIIRCGVYLLPSRYFGVMWCRDKEYVHDVHKTRRNITMMCKSLSFYTMKIMFLRLRVIDLASPRTFFSGKPIPSNYPPPSFICVSCALLDAPTSWVDLR